MCEARHAEAAAQEQARVISAIDAVNTRSILRTDVSEKADTQNKVIIRVIHDQAAAMPEANDVCINPVLADSLRALN